MNLLDELDPVEAQAGAAVVVAAGRGYGQSAVEPDLRALGVRTIAIRRNRCSQQGVLVVVSECGRGLLSEPRKR
jgi:hypothetical protein